MHDILEGVAPLDIKIVLEHLFSQKIMTLEEINHRIAGFNYRHLSRDKPSPFSSKSLCKSDTLLSQSASQTYCMVKCMTFIFGDKYESNNPKWNLFLILLDILDIILSPCVSESTLPYLQSLIEDHHQLYRALTYRALRPKHHHVLPYPEAIRQIGPLLYFWTMRLEARHKFFKNVARIGSNFKNIAKSVSNRNQLLLSYKFLLNTAFDQFEVHATGKVHFTSIQLERNIRTIFAEYFNLTSNYELSTYKTISVNGVSIKVKDVVLEIWLGDNEMPKFVEIEQIIEFNGQFNFLVFELSTLHFSRHFHAFAIEITENRKLVQIQNIDLLRPLLTHTNVNNEFLVSLPYMIS